jgi:catechol 2,3-dioxygenase-like lactoylglutathione lyase family enzyme
MKSGLSDAPVVAMLAEDDLEQARRFWRETVGLEEIYYDERYAEAGYRAGGTVFAIYEHEGGSAADHTQLAFQVQDVRSMKQKLEQQGIMFQEYDLPNVKTVNGVADMGGAGEGSWFLDPGGNIIGIFTVSERFVGAMQPSSAMAGVGSR